MTKLRFVVEKAYVGGVSDAVYLSEGENADLLEELALSVVQAISTDVMVTVSGVTLHLAAWQDPEHWADDWRELAGDEDVEGFVANLLAAAIEQ